MHAPTSTTPTPVADAAKPAKQSTPSTAKTGQCIFQEKAVCSNIDMNALKTIFESLKLVFAAEKPVPAGACDAVPAVPEVEAAEFPTTDCPGVPEVEAETPEFPTTDCPFWMMSAIEDKSTDVLDWCARNNRPDVVKAVASKIDVLSSKTFYFACERGHLEVFKQLLTSYGNKGFSLDGAMYIAAVNGYVEMFEALYDMSISNPLIQKGAYNFERCFVGACVNGHVNVLNFLQKRHPADGIVERCRSVLLTETIKNLDVMKFLHNFSGPFSHTEQERIYKKVTTDEIFTYLRNVFPAIPFMFYIALENGCTGILKYTFDRLWTGERTAVGQHWDKKRLAQALSYCIARGHSEAFHWFLDFDKTYSAGKILVPGSAHAIKAYNCAIRNGKLEFLRAMRYLYLPVRHDSVESCIMAHHIDVIRYLVENNLLTKEQVTEPVQSLFVTACMHDVKIAKYLAKTFQLTADDALANDKEALKWCLNYPTFEQASFLIGDLGITAQDLKSCGRCTNQMLSRNAGKSLLCTVWAND